MKKILLIVLLFLAVFHSSFFKNHTSHADTFELSDLESAGLQNVGFAPFNLTARTFNCEGFLQSLKPLKEIHIAFLYNTFGNDFSCLNRILSDERLKTLEVNLINEPGHRNNRLGSYEFLFNVGTVSDYNKKLISRNSKLKKKLTEYVVPLQNVLSENLQNQTVLLINPGLESNLSPKAGKVLVSWTRELFPEARIVWNPYRAALSTRKVVNADIIEGHGMYPKLNEPCLYNMDGTDVKYADRPALDENSDIKNYYHSGSPLFQTLEKYANRCEVAFVWTQESNGLSYKTGFKDPRRRNHNISASMYKKILKDVISVHRRGKIDPKVVSYTEQDDAIASSCSKIHLTFEDGHKSGKLLKQSEFPDRGGVLILPKNFASVKKAHLYKENVIVDTYAAVGLYKDGRVLFRSSKSPTTYPLNTYLVFDVSENNRQCFRIPNPRIRLD